MTVPLNIESKEQFRKEPNTYDEIFLQTIFAKISIIDYCRGLKQKSSHRSCSVKKGVFRNFIKFTGKQPQKEPPEVFSKRICSEKFCIIHRKISVLESLFNKVNPTQVFSCEY